MEEQRQNAYKDSEVERFIVDIIGNRAEVTPLFDLAFGYRYPDVEEGLNKKPEEARKFLERLANAGILDRRLHVVGIRCPKCEESNVDTQYICPFCNSIDVEKDALIEHIACGYIDILTNFKSDEDYICPKCHSKLEMGSYRTAGSWYSCSSCGKRVEFPKPQHKCRNCETVFNLDSAISDRVYAYSLSKVAREEIGRGTLLRSMIRERASTLGYEVKAPYLVKGESGVEHPFDMMLLKQDVKTAVDVILSDSPISQFEIMKEYIKIFDTKASLYLIVIPELSDDAKKLVALYKMNVIESASPQGALEALIKSLGSEKGRAEEVPARVTSETTKKDERARPLGELKETFRSLFKRRK